jgi:mannan endo-1,4-beta-mannosidase
MLVTIIIMIASISVPPQRSLQTIPFFVSRSGTNFVLNGEPFFFAGTNSYYLPYRSSFMANDVLTTAANNHFQVIRTMGFLDLGNPDGSESLGVSEDGTYFQYWNGTAPAYNDGANGLQKLDYVIYRARQLGLKLIIPLTDNWENHGGMDQYVLRSHGQYHDQFYSDPIIQKWYQEYIRHILSRINSYNNTAYKNDPTIFAWELANEPQCYGSGSYSTSPHCSTATLIHWVAQMSAYAKKIDAHHLVGVGDEGFYCIPGAVEWTENCSRGQDTIALARVSTIDYMSVHLYPDTWGKSIYWGTSWITRHITDGHEVGKPVLLEEFGSLDQTNRDTVYQTWTQTTNDSGGNGNLAWQLSGHTDDGNLNHLDPYTFYCPSQTCTVLSDQTVPMFAKQEDCIVKMHWPLLFSSVRVQRLFTLGYLVSLLLHISAAS